MFRNGASLKMNFVVKKLSHDQSGKGSNDGDLSELTAILTIVENDTLFSSCRLKQVTQVLSSVQQWTL
jgi:hypothetical protein